MQPYLRTRSQRDKDATVTGLIITGVVHVLAVVACLLFGLTYLYPPPPELSFLVDFTEQEELVEEVVVPAKDGTEAQAEEADPENKVELVQKAESPQPTTKPNTTPTTKPDKHGDVPVDQPTTTTPELDPRATFPGMSTKDNTSTTPHGATDPSSNYTAGQPDGNTSHGKTDGTASAQLKGRTVDGRLHKPSYEAQADGKVVVSIKVDQYGNVTEAVAGAAGTTITDKNLWNAARAAAMKTKFNQSASAPAIQEGTITYIFKLQ